VRQDEQNTKLQGKALLERIVQLAREKKGVNLVALDVSKLVYYTNYFLILSGRTDLHVKGIAKHVEKELAAADIHAITVEGQDFHRWVLMDYGEVMVQLFLEPLRDLYELEKLWADAPIIELGEEEKGFDEDEFESDESDDLFADFD
jgi:ribosome-associated protein